MIKHSSTDPCSGARWPRPHTVCPSTPALHAFEDGVQNPSPQPGRCPEWVQPMPSHWGNKSGYRDTADRWLLVTESGHGWPGTAGYSCQQSLAHTDRAMHLGTPVSTDRPCSAPSATKTFARASRPPTPKAALLTSGFQGPISGNMLAPAWLFLRAGTASSLPGLVQLSAGFCMEHAPRGQQETLAEL